jgi:hypothetical protein
LKELSELKSLVSVLTRAEPPEPEKNSDSADV